MVIHYLNNGLINCTLIDAELAVGNENHVLLVPRRIGDAEFAFLNAHSTAMRFT